MTLEDKRKIKKIHRLLRLDSKASQTTMDTRYVIGDQMAMQLVEKWQEEEPTASSCQMIQDLLKAYTVPRRKELYGIHHRRQGTTIYSILALIHAWKFKSLKATEHTMAKVLIRMAEISEARSQDAADGSGHHLGTPVPRSPEQDHQGNGTDATAAERLPDDLQDLKTSELFVQRRTESLQATIRAAASTLRTRTAETK